MTHRQSLILSFIAAAILLLLYVLSSSGSLGANPVGETSRDTSPLIVPAGYAFAIWGLIYTGLFAFPIYQWFNRQEGAQRWITIRKWYAANVIANGVWLALASYSLQWSTVIVIIFMLISLYKINTLLSNIHREHPINYLFEQFVFSIYFAWISLATVLNVSSALEFNNWNGLGITPEIWALIMLSIAALITSLVTYQFKDRAYAGVIIWAFVAIIVKHVGNLHLIVYLCMAVIALFIGHIIRLSIAGQRVS